MKSARSPGLPNLDFFITQKRMTRKEIADELGISYIAFWKYVKGRTKNIHPEMLRKLANLLGCSIDDLLSESLPDDKSLDSGHPLELDLLRAWREAKEAAEALSPEFIADGVTQEEARDMHTEIGAAIVSLTAARDHLEQFLEAA